MFKPLLANEIRQIVEIQLNDIASNLEKSGIMLKIMPKALDAIAQLGYDPQFGARPVKRLIQREVLNELSKQIISGSVNKEKPIVVSHVDEQFVFTNN